MKNKPKVQPGKTSLIGRAIAALRSSNSSVQEARDMLTEYSLTGDEQKQREIISKYVDID